MTCIQKNKQNKQYMCIYIYMYIYMCIHICTHVCFHPCSAGRAGLCRADIEKALLEMERARWIDTNNGKEMGQDEDTHTTTRVVCFRNTKTDGYIQAWTDGCKKLQKNKWIQTHTHTHKASKHKDRWMHASTDENMQIMERVFVDLWIQRHTHRVGMFPWFRITQMEREK